MPNTQQEVLLDLLTPAIILCSPLDNENKARYLHYLSPIYQKLASVMFMQAPTFADWDVLSDWLTLSQQFYAQCSIPGKVFGSWTSEDKLSDMVFLMKETDLNKERGGEMVDIDAEIERMFEEMYEKEAKEKR